MAKETVNVNTYSQTDVYYDISENKSVSLVRCVVGNRLGGKQNRLVQQERLSEQEADQAETWEGNGQDWPFERLESHHKQRVWRLGFDYEKRMLAKPDTPGANCKVLKRTFLPCVVHALMNAL